ERRRLRELIWKSRGRPSNLSAREREEADELLEKLDYAELGGDITGTLLPFRPLARLVEFALGRAQVQERRRPHRRQARRGRRPAARPGPRRRSGGDGGPDLRVCGVPLDRPHEAVAEVDARLPADLSADLARVQVLPSDLAGRVPAPAVVGLDRPGPE